MIVGAGKAVSTVYAGTLDLAAVNGTISIEGGRTLAVTTLGSIGAGTLIDDGAFTTGTLQQTGGAIVSAGTLAAASGIGIAGGSLQQTGGTIAIAAGGLLIGGAATSVVLNGGTADILGGMTVQAGSLSLGNTLAADSLGMTGGSLAVGAGADMTIAGTSAFSGGGATVSGGLLYDTGGGLTVGNTATLDVTGGELALAGATTLTADTTIGGGIFYVTTGGLSLGGGALLSVSGGDATVSGQTTIAAGAAMLTGGTFFVAAGGLGIGNNGTLTTGGAFTQVSGGATLQAGGLAAVDAGTFFISDHGLAVASGGSLSVGGGNATVEGGVALAGAATVGGGTFYAASGGLAVVAGGSFVATGGQTTIIGGLASAGSVTLSSAGTLAVDTLAVTAGRFADASASFVVSGLASFSGGTDSFSAGAAFGAGTLAVGNTVTLAGAGLGIGAGGIDDTGALTGYGILQGTITGSGSVVASGGVLQLNTDVVSASTRFTIAATPGSLLLLLGTVAPAVTIGFAGAQGVLELHDLTSSNGVDTLNFAGSVAGMTVGTTAAAPTNAIDVQGATVTGAVLAGNVLNILDQTGTVASIALTQTSGAALDTAHANWQPDTVRGGTDIFLSDVVCFAAGTHILTPRGEVPVESLHEGDPVVTLAGPRPVTWIGHRRLDLRRHPLPEQAAPIRIRRGALAPGVPHRDLLVSPDHGMFLRNRLVPAKLLVNGMTIVQERQVPAVHYFHIELERHAVLVAEGAAAESYLDTGNRAFFANAGLAVVLHPEFAVNAALKRWDSDAVAPLSVTRPEVGPIWQDLAWRAAALGYRPRRFETTPDPDLRLLTDGRAARAVARDATHAVFAIPAGARAARLCSRWDIPADQVPGLDDFRRLGVRVERIRLRRNGQVTDIAPDSPALRRGWHAPESDGPRAWRWSSGDAWIPLPGGPALLLEVWLGDGMAYRLPGTIGPARAPRAAA